MKIHPRYFLIPFVLLLALSFVFVGRAADHAESPALALANAPLVGDSDINDVYIFRSPTDARKTVLIMTTNPFAGTDSPTTFDSRVSYRFNLDTNGDAREDIVFTVRFGRPHRRTDVQPMILRAWFKKNKRLRVFAIGKTGKNIKIKGVRGRRPRVVGTVRAALQDDPFFFDAIAFSDLIIDGKINGNGGPDEDVTFPRDEDDAHNFFGPSGRAGQGPNVLAIVIEIDSSLLGKRGDKIGFWGATDLFDKQVDRMGFPAINTALIPPVPREDPMNVVGTNRQNRQDEFNETEPRDDRRLFRRDMISILEKFYGRPAGNDVGQSGFIADLLLPDILPFQIGNENGFDQLNGRRLEDDVINVELGLLTGGAITSDGVGNDSQFQKVFPYIGRPNRRPQGPNMN